MTTADTCPKCEGPLRIDERASRGAGKLIYECRTCDKHFSLRARETELVEEAPPEEDPGSKTARMRAFAPPRRAAKTLSEMKPPTGKDVLPEGLSITLEIADGPERGRSVRVDRAKCVLGRDEGDVRIADQLISRRHAVLEVFDLETIILKDLSSTNGTYHNGRLIDHCKLMDGDELRVGSTIINVLIEKPPEPAG